MANHGISTVGETVADAYDRLYYIERAAQVQIYAMWTGQRLKQLPEPVVEKTKRDIGGSSNFEGPSAPQRHFDALSACSTARSRTTRRRVQAVMRGLDPRIHLASIRAFLNDGLPGHSAGNRRALHG